jgi:hypothetical protein
MGGMPVKRCTKCGEAKPLDEFYKDSRYRDGHISQCKECKRIQGRDYTHRNLTKKLAYNAKWRVSNPDKVKAQAQRYYGRHREQIKAYSVLWVAAHRETCKEMYRRYREKHKELLLERSRDYESKNYEWRLEQHRQWRASNPEKSRELTRRWNHLHPDKRREVERRYRTNHPDKMRDKARLRYARKLGAITELVIRAQVYQRDNGRCHICGKKVNSQKWHLDHLVPLSLGGEHSYRNVAVACPGCNLRRSNTGSAQLRLLA